MKRAISIFTIAVSLAYACSEKGLVDMEVNQYQVPILIGKPENPVVHLLLMPSGADGVNIRKISVSLKGTTDISDLKAIRLYIAEKSKSFNSSRQLDADMEPAGSVTFSEGFEIHDTVNLWVSAVVDEKADLLHKVGITCMSVLTSAGRLIPDTSYKAVIHRIGVALRQHFDDGVDTYRIPGLTTTAKGTLLAVYDVRRQSSRDLQGDIDIGFSRSTDGGNTWEPMKIAIDMENWGGLPEKFNGVSDACILADELTGDIFIAGLWMHGVLDRNGKWIEGLSDTSDAWEHQWRNKGSQPGFGVRETSQFLLVKSTDDGITWSKPVNITTQGKRKEWWLWAPAPGHGVTLTDGTLVMPTQGRDENGQPFSCISWSRDRGATWTTSSPAYKNTTECMAVQLSDGSIMLNMRHNGNRNNMTPGNGRAVAVTRDLGITWTEHPTSRNALIEPTCMGSLHRHYYTLDGQRRSILLFSNPDSRNSRTRMTIKASFDDGMTWPEENRLMLDELRSNGYSCLTTIDENTIGILYEGSQAQLTFEKISLSELIRR